MMVEYSEIARVFQENVEVFISFYREVSDLLSDGMDAESLDEGYYLFGNPNKRPSDHAGPFIMIEISGSVHNPIFAGDYMGEAIHYLQDNHARHMADGEEVSSGGND